MEEALEMLRRAKAELEAWEQRWARIEWCVNGCDKGAGQDGSGFFGSGFL
jgi:hypothetical protein